jgi:predicted GH43/DUF377 family glycosyl hydrolase
MELATSIFVIIFSIVAIGGAVLYTLWSRRKVLPKTVTTAKLELDRHHKNPVITPSVYKDWEIAGTFNPAAVIDDEGTTHILYRAIGADGISRLGYASSEDGTHFDTRSDYPVFSMKNPRTTTVPKAEIVQQYNPVMYPSGGSWGGCEDPRMVRINGRVYVTFNAFDGWDHIRIAVISLDEKKFKKGHWDWSEPFMISPAGQVNKNWVLFPEKINGKFAILHSVSPEVQIDYADFLEELASGKVAIKSRFGQKVARETWDTWVRGAGPPPIKTDKGWLVLYHAMDKKDPHIGYKLGALLLDLNDPKKVIARSPAPILTPEQWYENDWKAGVVYACGAVVKGGILSVYYGGGDKHTCVAQTELAPLLDWLLANGTTGIKRQ